MADGIFGQWGTVTFQVPDVLEDVRRTINDVAEFLVSVLDIALTLLRLAKAFLVGFLDPILALVQAIIDEIAALLRDLRQMGLYITGDWKLIDYPYKDIRGGFQEYERRMIARLTDRGDPTRPDVSAQSDVFALFLYLSVDTTDIERLIAFLVTILNFFNQKDNTPSSLPVPYITEVRYGSSTASIFQPQSLPEYFQPVDVAVGAATPTITPPNIAQVRWKIASPAQRSQFDPFPDLPPGGFIVSVSTLPDGIQVVYDRPLRDTDTKPSVQDPDTQVQPHDYGVVRLEDGRPLILYEGADFLENPDVLSYNESLDSSGNVKPNKSRVYGVRSIADNGVIPLEQLKDDDDTYYLQRHFYVPLDSVAPQWITGEYRLNLDLDDMPHAATVEVGSDGKMTLVDDGIPSSLYVRVASTTSSLASGDKYYEYSFTQAKQFLDAAKKPFVMSLFDREVNITDIGRYSDPQVVTFPNANTAEYLKAVRAALTILVLSRPDLILLDDLKASYTPEALQLIAQDQLILPGVALQASGLENLRHLLGFVYDDYATETQKREETPLDFRKDLRERVDKAVHDFYAKTGPMPEVEAAVVQQTELLRTITWGDIFAATHPSSKSFIPNNVQEATILDSLNIQGAGGETQAGLALNPFCMGIPEAAVVEMFSISNLFRDRKPQMMEGPVNVEDPSFDIVTTATPEKAAELLELATPGLRIFYEKYRQEDGSISVPPDAQPLLSAYESANRLEGSADDSPVFYLGFRELEKITDNPLATSQAADNAGVFYCRSLLANVEDGQLYQQAAIALGASASAFRRSPADGEWIALRFLDQLPYLEDALQVLLNWLEAVKNSIDSIIETIRKYIEFVEARLIELQQLIVRINALIQSLLGYAFRIPKCSALFLRSQGTDGVLADLVTADNKPSDGPLAYGAGVAILIPLPFGAAALALELLQALLVKETGSQDLDETLTSGSTIPAAIGLEALPGPPPVPPTDEGPDVL